MTNPAVIHIAGGGGETSIPLQWAKGLRGNGTDVEFISLSEFRRVNGFLWLFHLINRVRKQQGVVIHVHHALPCIISLLVRMVRPRAVLCVSVHREFGSLSLGGKLAHLLAFMVANRIVANSIATRSTLPRFVQSRSVDVVYNGVETGAISRWSSSSSRAGLLFVGRLIKDKNVDALIQAFSQLENDQAFLRIVGDGPERGALERLTAELGLEERIEFLGLQSRSRVYQLMHEHSTLIVPSVTEGYCNVAVEGMAAGLLVVYTPCPALVEVVGGGGVKASGFCAAQIRDALQRAFALSPRERKIVLDEALERAERMDMAHTIEQFKSIYREAFSP